MGYHNFMLVLHIISLIHVFTIISSSQSSLSASDEFPSQVRLFQSQSSCSEVAIAAIPSDPSYSLPPRLLLIAFPSNHSGEFPVLLFKHGMSISVCYYSELMRHIASYGYVVVAPQEPLLGQLNFFDCTKEIDATARVVNWLPTNLAILLATQAMPSTAVMPNLDKLFLAGHSRGGKIVYALALGLGNVQITLPSSNFSGLITLDPVDGSSSWVPLGPAITSRSKCELGFPTLIEGTGLGGKCASSAFSHQAFYRCTKAPIVYHLVPSQYGHMDFLNDGALLWMARLCGRVSELSRAGMRNFTGGLIVAFLESTLNVSTEPMQAILSNWQSASVDLEKPECSTNGTAVACPGMEFHASSEAADVASTIDALAMDHTEL